MKRLFICFLSILMFTACSTSNTSVKEDNSALESDDEIAETQEVESEDIAEETVEVSQPDALALGKWVRMYSGVVPIGTKADPSNMGDMGFDVYYGADGKIAAIMTTRLSLNSISDESKEKFCGENGYGVLVELSDVVPNIVSSITFYPQIINSLAPEQKTEVDSLVSELFLIERGTEVTMLEVLNRADNDEEMYEYIRSINSANKLENIGISGFGGDFGPGYDLYIGMEVYDPPIGTVKVNVDNLNVRNAPSTSADKVDSISSNSYTPYDFYVFDIKDEEGYTWYNIGGNHWIASKDDWISFSPFDEH